jgi:hypothetical protein
MAVVAPPPLKLSFDVWGAGNSAIYPGDQVPMEIMTYQYPPPPSQSGADIDIPHSVYQPNYPVPQSAVSAGTDHDSGPDPRILTRRDSLSKALKLKRSMSSSNVRPLQGQSAQQQLPPPQEVTTPEQTALSLAAEKKRNKLGYHRTSVACGKCFSLFFFFFFFSSFSWVLVTVCMSESVSKAACFDVLKRG